MKPDEIKEFRKSKKMSQEVLGDLCGVTKATVSKWEQGVRNPSGAALIQLERVMKGEVIPAQLSDLEVKLLDENVKYGKFKNREDYLTASLKYLIQFGTFMPIDPEQRKSMASEKISPITSATEETEDLYEMELLGAAAAGTGVDGDHLGSVMLRNQYPSHYKAVKVIGDSMDDGSEISIADGCTAIVNPNWSGRPFAVKNRIYAWNIDGGQVLKKFVRRKVDGKTQGFLESINPTYEPIPYTEDMRPQGEFVAVEC